MPPVLISVHFPKAGGTSTLRALQAALGPERVRVDYTDNPADPQGAYRLDPVGFRAARPRTLDGIAAVHGHFHPEKYALIAPETRRLVTILREPVDNLLSIYRFWRSVPSHDGLHGYFLRHALSPVALARLPLIGRLMTETYFGGYDMRQFDFIGDAADYPAALRAISAFLEVPLEERVENVSPELDIAPAVRTELAQILAPEIAFYRRWRGYRRADTWRTRLLGARA